MSCLAAEKQQIMSSARPDQSPSYPHRPYDDGLSNPFLWLRGAAGRLRRRVELDREFAQQRLKAFLDSTREAAKATCDRLPEAYDNDLAGFAIADLLPNRVLTACRFIREMSDADARHLDRFLDGVERDVADELAEAEQPAQVADAVLSAAEDLHSYLLAHDLVDRRYSRLQDLRSALFGRGDDPILTSWESWRAERLGSATAAVGDSHEYALSA